MHYELNTGALLSAAIGQSLLGNWSTATEFHLSHRWEPGIRPQLTINSWLWAEKGVVGLWEVVVKGSVCWEVTVIQVSSFAFFSPPLTCRPHSRPAVRDTYPAGGRDVWNAVAMQVSPLMTPSPHSPWRPPTPPALAHTSYLSEFWQCQVSTWNISTISIHNFSYQLTPAALVLYLLKLWPHSHWWISTNHPHTFSLINKGYGQSFRPCGF